MATAKHYCAVRPSLSIQTLQIVNLQTSGSAVNWTLMVWENIPTRCFEDSNNERWRCGDGFIVESTSRDSTPRALCRCALVWVFNDLQVCNLPHQNTFARITGTRRIEKRISGNYAGGCKLFIATLWRTLNWFAKLSKHWKEFRVVIKLVMPQQCSMYSWISNVYREI